MATLFDFKTSVENTKFMAALCIKAAKQHVISCGGDTVICTISHDDKGQLRIRREPATDVLRYEQDTGEIRDGLKLIFQVLDTDNFPDDSAVEDMASTISEAAIQFRKKQKERKEILRKQRSR